MSDRSNGRYGMSLLGVCGAVFAGIISWQTNKSIIWLALHVLFGWFYVIYRAFGFGGEWV